MSTMIKVEQIEKNLWNPNVADSDVYLALKEDMRNHGTLGIGPILISPADVYFQDKTLKDRYVVVDGENRLNAAKELNWPEIRCDIQLLKE